MKTEPKLESSIDEATENFDISFQYVEEFAKELLSRERVIRSEIRDKIVSREGVAISKWVEGRLNDEEIRAEDRLKERIEREVAESKKRIGRKLKIERIQIENRLSHRQADLEKAFENKRQEIIREELADQERRLSEMARIEEQGIKAYEDNLRQTLRQAIEAERQEKEEAFRKKLEQDKKERLQEIANKKAQLEEELRNEAATHLLELKKKETEKIRTWYHSEVAKMKEDANRAFEQNKESELGKLRDLLNKETVEFEKALSEKIALEKSKILEGHDAEIRKAIENLRTQVDKDRRASQIKQYKDLEGFIEKYRATLLEQERNKLALETEKLQRDDETYFESQKSKRIDQEVLASKMRLKEALNRVDTEFKEKRRKFEARLLSETRHKIEEIKKREETILDVVRADVEAAARVIQIKIKEDIDLYVEQEVATWADTQRRILAQESDERIRNYLEREKSQSENRIRCQIENEKKEFALLEEQTRAKEIIAHQSRLEEAYAREQKLAEERRKRLMQDEESKANERVKRHLDREEELVSQKRVLMDKANLRLISEWIRNQIDSEKMASRNRIAAQLEQVRCEYYEKVLNELEDNYEKVLRERNFLISEERNQVEQAIAEIAVSASDNLKKWRSELLDKERKESQVRIASKINEEMRESDRRVSEAMERERVQANTRLIKNLEREEEEHRNRVASMLERERLEREKRIASIEAEQDSELERRRRELKGEYLSLEDSEKSKLALKVKQDAASRWERLLEKEQAWQCSRRQQIEKELESFKTTLEKRLQAEEEQRLAAMRESEQSEYEAALERRREELEATLAAESEQRISQRLDEESKLWKEKTSEAEAILREEMRDELVKKLENEDVVIARMRQDYEALQRNEVEKRLELEKEKLEGKYLANIEAKSAKMREEIDTMIHAYEMSQRSLNEEIQVKIHDEQLEALEREHIELRRTLIGEWEPRLKSLEQMLSQENPGQRRIKVLRELEAAKLQIDERFSDLIRRAKKSEPEHDEDLSKLVETIPPMVVAGVLSNMQIDERVAVLSKLEKGLGSDLLQVMSPRDRSLTLEKIKDAGTVGTGEVSLTGFIDEVEKALHDRVEHITH